MKPILLLILSISGFFIASRTNAQVPNILNYQGRIAVRGVPFEGTGQFKFALVNGGTVTTPAARTAIASAVVNSGFVTSVTVVDGGAGYATSPTVTISGGGGNGATAVANVTDGEVTGFTITSPGSDCGSAPTVNVDAPPAPTPTTDFVSYWSNDGTSVAGSEPTSPISLPVTKGLFSARLGDSSSVYNERIPNEVFTISDVRLRIWFSDGTNGWQILSPDHDVVGLGYNSAAISTITLSRLIDEVAVYGLAGIGYMSEDFPTGPVGRNSLVHQPTLLLNWDSTNSSLTSRSLTRSASGNAPLNPTFNVNGYCQNVTGSLVIITIRQAARMIFDYVDGTSSAQISIPNGNYSVANPSPNKPVKNIRVSIFHTSGGGEFCSISTRPVFITSFPRSMDLLVNSIPENTFGLRVYPVGTASDGKDFRGCTKWWIIFSDESSSAPASFDDTQIIPKGKTPVRLRFETEPATLGASTIDITKVVVRFITN